MKNSVETLTFNRGLVSAKALGRLDLSKVKLGAEVFRNWWPDSLGPMQLRPGLQYIGATKSNAAARLIPFVFSADDTAQIELTDSVMRVRVADSLVTRPSVSASITNGSFTSDVSGWTDADEGSAVSDWEAGYLRMIGTGTSAAIRQQTVTVTNTGTQHALRVVVERNPVEMLIGSTVGGREYFIGTLSQGTHSIAFTPTGNFTITFRNRAKYYALVDSVAVESAGTLEIPTPWPADALSLIRYDQSGNVIFLACEGYEQQKIERLGDGCWSVTDYKPLDGPFNAVSTSGITISSNVKSGFCTLTANSPLFTSDWLGSLIKLESIGQEVSSAIAAQNTFTEEIRVTGVDDARKFQITITGTFTATLTLQRSVGEPGDWQDVTTYTSATDVSYDDSLDNQIIYYRIGIKTGAYTSGTATASLTYSSGSIAGVARIVTFASNVSVGADILKTLGGTGATPNWSEGGWSARSGYPSAVALHEGRLWWAGKDKFFGSVTDAFDSFDPEFEGDAGPINRSIGFGPVDSISWLLPMHRLLAGTDGAVLSCRSSSLDEPITPTNFNVKAPSTQASARIQAAKVDNRAVYVQRSGKRVYQMAFSVETGDYQSGDLTGIAPEVGEPALVALGVQRQPDTMIHAVRSDGVVAILMFEPDEEIRCWFELETDGDVEDVCVLPGSSGDDDQVYYVVKRTINGSTVRYIEKLASIDNCQGESLNLQADSFVSSSGSAISTLSGLSHLEGEEVVIWADGQSRGTATVSGGSIALGGTYSDVVAGLVYTAQWKGTKLGLAVNDIGGRKRIHRIGVILRNTHAQGVQYGRDFSNLDDLPRYDANMAAVDQDSVMEEWDGPMVAFPGEWTADSRVCLQAQAPKPAQVLAMVIEAESNR